MTSGSSNFNVILGDNKFERLLTASTLLSQAIKERPTISGIEQTHDVHLNRVYKPFVKIWSEYMRFPSLGGASTINSGSSVWRFELNPKGQFISDMVLEINLPLLGNGGEYDANVAPYYRYCAYPGVRLIQKASIYSKNVAFASYTRDDVILSNKFFLDGEHRIGFERCNGQEQIKESQYFMGKHTGVFLYKDGLQTPKTQQTADVMFVPLHFDFCKDIRNALISQTILNRDDRNYVEIITSPITEMVQMLKEADKNPYGEDLEVIHNSYLPNNLPITMSLLVNNLFINQEINDILARDLTFSLFRTKVTQYHSITQDDSILLNSIKLPVEYLLVGARSRNYNMRHNMDQWNLMGYPEILLDPEKIFTTYVRWMPLISELEIFPANCRKTSQLGKILESIGVDILGIPIFPQTATLFYNSYLPTRFRNATDLRTPDDGNSYLIPFCQYPGNADPSGYFNMSAAREVRLTYKLTPSIEERIRSLNVRFEIVISATVLNFIIQKNGFYNLKYG